VKLRMKALMLTHFCFIHLYSKFRWGETPSNPNSIESRLDRFSYSFPDVSSRGHQDNMRN
jgi:hypothetical protein